MDAVRCEEGGRVHGKQKIERTTDDRRPTTDDRRPTTDENTNADAGFRTKHSYNVACARTYRASEHLRLNRGFRLISCFAFHSFNDMSLT
jgi:hypothetical protein